MPIAVALPHCVPIEIFSNDVEVDVWIDVAVGGVPTDGVVAVGVTPPPLLPIPPIPCGTSRPVFASSCTKVTLHYIATPIVGPDEIEVEYDIRRK